MPEFGTKAWLKEQDDRVAYINRLYHLEGRDDPNHPMHSLYTGLYQNRQKVLMELDRTEQLKA